MTELGKFKSDSLNPEIQSYLQELESFVVAHHLEAIAEPNSLDHLAVKARNSSDFEQFLESVKPSCSSLSFIRLNNRRLATALLKSPLSLGQFGSTTVLEIMEPKPEKSGLGLVGFEHVELYHPDLDQVMKILKAQGVAGEFYQNASHQAVVVVINNKTQEVKFTNRHLAEIVASQIKDGTSTVIK